MNKEIEVETDRIIEKLNALAELKSALDVLAMERDEIEQKIIPPDVRAALKELDEEYAPKLSEAREKISSIEAEIKALVVAHGETVKGDYIQAVYVKGRTSWDTRALDGYAKAHPELSELRRVGDPTVSLRTL